MNLLLDTHIALWAVVNPERLSQQAIALLENPQNAAFISPVSLWEIAIKHALGERARGAMPIGARQAAQFFDEAGFFSLALNASHAVAVDDLPVIHSDPFDRLLVAQALSEPMRLVTHDRQLGRYSDTVIVI